MQFECMQLNWMHTLMILHFLFYFSDLQNQFTSSFGVLLSMLGSVVGTGNIWRFPRIVANHATEGGLHPASCISMYPLLTANNYRGTCISPRVVWLSLAVVDAHHSHRVRDWTLH